MNRAMFAAASGMAAQQTQLEIVADNLANADVAGFKGASATFADVRAGALGLGTTSVGKHAVFAQGKLVRSGGPFDLAIDGPGFFAVERHGARGYTRNGEFARDADGTLRNSAGWALSGVRIPAGALAARVERDGRVVIDTAAAKGRTVAHLRLAAFASPEALRPLGATLFAATEGSGRARLFAPGAHDGPSIAFGMLERSNVSIIEAMMQILGAQRAVPSNSRISSGGSKLPRKQMVVPKNGGAGQSLASVPDPERPCAATATECGEPNPIGQSILFFPPQIGLGLGANSVAQFLVGFLVDRGSSSSATGRAPSTPSTTSDNTVLRSTLRRSASPVYSEQKCDDRRWSRRSSCATMACI